MKTNKIGLVLVVDHGKMEYGALMASHVIKEPLCNVSTGIESAKIENITDNMDFAPSIGITNPYKNSIELAPIAGPPLNRRDRRQAERKAKKKHK